ncbi:MAG: hypothetical protein NUW21_08150 [Elusimicrobia bacterium]|nr:hypothetical protein [Elusimicrobiota bacterium]
MPIRPENRARYPVDWKALSNHIRFERAEKRCECPGGAEGCGLHRGRRCEEHHGERAKWARGKVILTVAHLDHDPANCRDENLAAMCQRCHLRYDRQHHAETAALTRDARRGQARLFDVRGI